LRVWRLLVLLLLVGGFSPVWAGPAVDFLALNWTTTDSALLTVGFNESVSFVAVYYGTGSHSSLDHLLNISLGGSYDGNFPILIQDLASDTAYNFSVYPNASVSGWDYKGNFTTQSGVCSFEFAYHNDTDLGWSDPAQSGSRAHILNGSYNWWNFYYDTGGYNDVQRSWDSDSSGNIYIQGRMGYKNASVAPDLEASLGLWEGSDWAACVMMQNATIASSRFGFWAYDANAGPNWVELTNISEIQPGRFYNVTIMIHGDNRWSVQGTNNSYWVKIDGSDWQGPFGCNGWIDDSGWLNALYTNGDHSPGDPVIDWVIVQNRTFASLNTLFNVSGVTSPWISFVNQSEPSYWFRDQWNWLNLSLRYNPGSYSGDWSNISLVDIQVNTTGDVESFTLRWNGSDFSLSELSDAAGICSINSWFNTTGGQDLSLHINLTISSPATLGWCDKYVNASGDGGATYSNLTNNVFVLTGPWTHVREITIDPSDLGISESLSDFPVLLHLSDVAGVNCTDVTDIFDVVGASWAKINVTDSSNSSLYVEVEDWDAANEEAWLWVKVPSITGLTKLYFYYAYDVANNTAFVGLPGSSVAQNVWSNGFVLVDHALDDPDSSHTPDSSPEVNNGSKSQAGSPAESSGLIGFAQYFNGTDDACWIDFGDDASLNFGSSTNFTLEAWVKVSGTERIILEKRDYADPWKGYYIKSDSDGKLEVWCYAAADTWVTSSSVIADNSWHYVVGTFNRTSNISAYVDGVLEATDTIDSGDFDTTNPLYAGDKENPWCSPPEGLLDELRVSNVTRSAAWVKASYYSGLDRFVGWGPAAYAVSELILNWTTTDSALLTIEFNQSVKEVKVFYGTGPHSSLDHVLSVDLGGEISSGPFAILIQDLASATAYNFSVYPNISVAGWDYKGNFTTQDGVCSFEFGYHNATDIGWGTDGATHNQHLVSFPAEPFNWYHYSYSGGECYNDIQKSWDSDSTGHIYLQARMGYKNASVPPDLEAIFGIWEGSDWAAAVMMQNATIASTRFSFWAYDWNAGPGWVELTNISEIQPGVWYNVTIWIHEDCRWSIQGANSSYWVSINGSPWQGPFAINAWIDDSGWLNALYTSADHSPGLPVIDWAIVQNRTFETLNISFTTPVGGGANITWVNQSETDPWVLGSWGWINLSLRYNPPAGGSGDWSNISLVDIQVNTTGDAESFSLRWNRSGFTLTELSDPSGICTLNDWWNTTGGQDLSLFINLTIADSATAGWCDKYVNASGDGNASYSNLSLSVFYLYSGAGPSSGVLVIRVFDNVSKSIPIGGALVWVWNSTWSDSKYTDGSGTVWWWNIKNGSYSVNASIPTHQSNSTTIPTAPNNLFSQPWIIYLEPHPGNWSKISVLDVNTSVGIPNALVGIGNSSFSLYINASCNGTLYVLLHDGLYTVNGSAPYFYAFNSSSMTAPANFTLFLAENHVFASASSVPWNFTFPYDDPWGGGADPRNSSSMHNWVSYNRLWWVTETSACIVVQYTNGTNCSKIRYQVFDPPADDPWPAQPGAGYPYKRSQSIYTNYSEMTYGSYYESVGAPSLDGSRWIHVLSNLTPGKLYYYEAWPDLAVGSWTPVGYFRTLNHSGIWPYEENFAGGNSSINGVPWLDRRDTNMHCYGWKINYTRGDGIASPRSYHWDNRSNWDMYWYGNNYANATGLTNLAFKYGNATHVVFETRMALQADPEPLKTGWGDLNYTTRTAEAHPSQPYMGEGAAFGLWNPQTHGWVFRVALANLSGPDPGSTLGAGFFGWRPDLGRFVRLSDNPYVFDFYGGWNMYNCWWNVTVVLPKEAICGGNASVVWNWFNYTAKVYVSGPGKTHFYDVKAHFIGSVKLGAPLSDGVFAVYEYLPDWEWRSIYGLNPPNNVMAAFDWTRISNGSAYNVSNVEWWENVFFNPPENGSAASEYSLFPTYFSINDLNDPFNLSAAGYVINATTFDAFGDYYNTFEFFENDTAYNYPDRLPSWGSINCVYVEEGEVLNLWFNISDWEYKDLCKEPLKSWPSDWLVVQLWPTHSYFYLDCAYLSSSSNWISLVFTKITEYDEVVIDALAWYDPVDNNSRYLGNWSVKTYRWNWTYSKPLSAGVTYSFDGVLYDLGSPQNMSSSKHPVAVYHDDPDFASSRPWGDAWDVPHVYQAFDCYGAELVEGNSGPQGFQGFGSAWFWNGSGVVGEDYLCVEVETGGHSYAEYYRLMKILLTSNASGQYVSLLFDPLSSSVTYDVPYWVLGVNDTNTTPLWSDHTYSVNLSSIDLPSFEWSFLPLDLGAGAWPQLTNITLPYGWASDNASLPDGWSVWIPNDGYPKGGYWVSNTSSSVDTGGIASLPRTLFAADMYYESVGSSSGVSVAVLVANASRLGHTNPSEPYVQLEFGRPASVNLWDITKVAVMYNASGIFWGVLSQHTFAEHDWDQNYCLGERTWFMTNMDLNVSPEWTDHTYGREDGPGNKYANKWFLPRFGESVYPNHSSDVGWWHVRGPHLLSMEENVTLPECNFSSYANRSDWLPIDGETYAMSEAGHWYGAVGAVPFWWRAVDLFMPSVCSSGYDDVYFNYEVASFFANASNLVHYSSLGGFKPWIDVQLRMGSPPSTNKLCFVSNSSGDWLFAFNGIGAADRQTGFVTVLATNDSDAVPSYADHSYMPHTEVVWDWEDYDVGSHDSPYWGSGWVPLRLNWSDNASLPSHYGWSEWNDAAWAAGRIYNGSSWAGWQPDLSGDDPASFHNGALFRAIDEFYPKRSWSGWGTAQIVGVWAGRNRTLRFFVEGSFGSEFGVNTSYLEVEFDWVEILADSPGGLDKIWFFKNASTLFIGFVAFYADQLNVSYCPVLLMTDSLALVKSDRNSTWTLDVVDYNTWQFYQSNWSIYPFDLSPSGLPHHDPTSPYTKYFYPDLSFYAEHTTEWVWLPVSSSEVFLVDSQWCPHPDGDVLSYYNASLFGLSSDITSYVGVRWDSGVPGSSGVWVKAYGMKHNASGFYVGWYVHGLHESDQFDIRMTIFFSDSSVNASDSYGSESYQAVYSSWFTINGSVYGVPPNGRWIWFKVFFWRFAIGRISYYTSAWESPSAFDFYEPVEIKFLKKVDCYGGYFPDERLVISNSSGTVLSLNITPCPDFSWQTYRLDPCYLSPGSYNVSLIVENITIFWRPLHIFRSNVSWVLSYNRFVYGGATRFVFRGINWRYWSQYFRDRGFFFDPDDGVALMCVLRVTVNNSQFELGRVYFPMVNDTESHEMRDITSGPVTIVLANPGALGRQANISVFAKRVDGSWVKLYSTLDTLQSSALFGEAFEELGAWLGLSASFVRIVVSLVGVSLLAVGFGYSAGLGASGYCVVILIGLWGFTVAGWLPAWFAMTSTLVFVATLIHGRGR